MPTGWLGRAVRALLWLLVAMAVAFGAAGIVTGTALPAGDDTRPELTVRADARLAPGLVAIEAGLGAMEADLKELWDMGRGVLVDLAAQPAGGASPEDISAKLDAGDALVLAIGQRAQALQAAYAQLPFDASSERISGRSKGRLLAVRAALGAVTPVADDWQLASARATITTRLIALLRLHDQQAGEAIRQGSAKDDAGNAKTPDLVAASASLKQAATTIAQATAIRDQLRSTFDVSTLSTWLDRNATFDQAYQTYCHLGLTSRDRRVLDRAYEVVKDALAGLPKTTDALVVIVGEAQGSGLTEALADLEQIRARVHLVARVD